MKSFAAICIVILFAACLSGCRKVREFTDENPDIAALQHGFKSSAAIGYCATLSNMAFSGQSLPSHVTFIENSSSEYSSSGIIHIKVTDSNPLPFNHAIGDVVIVALWDESQHSGVMSILFADIDLLAAKFRFYGLHTVPFAEEEDTGKVIAVFAEQDIVIGEGQDTLINLSLSRPKFNLEIDRVNSPSPTDAFAAVQQNIWFVKVNHHNTFPDMYDDSYEISGGGQIAEVRDDQGGIQYHALIEARFDYAACNRNPTRGIGFIQSISAGNSLNFDNITLDFHSSCDGKANVSFATGQYFNYIGRDVNLRFE